MCESINDQLNLVKLISYLFLILFSNHLSIKFRFLLAISNVPSTSRMQETENLFVQAFRKILYILKAAGLFKYV